MASRTLTDTQRTLQRSLDKATESAISYAAPEVPALGNLTPEGLLDELGYVNEAKKAIEKTEKILKERYKALSKNAKEGRGDNFKQTTTSSARVALNQGAVKDLLERFGNVYMTKLIEAIEEGIIEISEDLLNPEETALQQFMSETSVDTMRITRL